MSPHYFTKGTIVFLSALLIILCTFTILQARQPHRVLTGDEVQHKALPQAYSEEAAVFSSGGDTEEEKQQQRHLALLGQVLCVYAGPVGGGGELLQKLDIPLRVIPARWLAQLTNGGIEFANEETLLMALDNLDELAD